MIRYTFIFDDKSRIVFDVDEQSGSSHEEPGQAIPHWMRLDRHTCPDCTIPPGSRRSCPAALAIEPVVDTFDERLSFETVRVIIQRGNLKIESTVPTQNAIRSLIGLLLPLSDCPAVKPLRALALMHQPLGGKDHTVFRFLGLHFVAQYFRAQDGSDMDYSVGELKHLLGRIRQMNRMLAERIREVANQDATVNGLLILDSFVDAAELRVEGGLSRLRPLFETYLEMLDEMASRS